MLYLILSKEKFVMQKKFTYLHKLLFVTFLSCCFAVQHAQAAHYTVVASGQWRSSSTWQNGNVPPVTFSGGDIIEIPLGFAVTATADILFKGRARADKMIVNGSLTIASNTLRIDGAVFEGSGSVQADSFGGNFSHGFDYRGSVVANKMDGTTIVANNNVALTASKLFYAARSMQLNSGSLSIGSGCLVRLEGARLYAAVINIGHAATISFNGPYDVEYAGQGLLSGVELTNANLRKVELNLSASNGDILLNGNMRINDTLTLRRGIIDMGNKSITLGANANFRTIGQSSFRGNCSNMTINATNPLSSPIQFVEGSMANVDTLSINTGNVVKINGRVMVAHWLDIANGKLEMVTGVLRLPLHQSSINTDRNRYIISNNNLVTAYIAPNTSVTFPVGTATQYLPLTVTTRATAMQDVGIHVINGVKQFGTSGTEWHRTKPVVNATWHLYSAALPTTDFDIRVDWPRSAEVNGFDRSTAYIAKFLGDEWDDYEPAAAQFNVANSKYFIGRANMDTTNMEIAVFDKNTVSVNDIVKQQGIKAYPNPVKDVLYIDMPEQANVIVCNATGQQVQQHSHLQGRAAIATSTLPQGIYFVKISGSTVSAAFSFIKE